jgi:hypothetical protein
MTVIIVWILTDFHVIDVLSKGNIFNAHYYVFVIMQSLADWVVGEIGATKRKLMIRADNTRSYTVKVSLAFIKQNEMKMESHPSYSLDLALSDFFDHIKGILSNCPFQLTDDLLSEMKIILVSIKAIVLDVFPEWMQRLEQYCDINSNYIK